MPDKPLNINQIQPGLRYSTAHSNLDLEDNDPAPENNGFFQPYTSRDTYSNKNPKQSIGNLKDKFGKTKYDMTDPSPNDGAPISDPRFQQKYTPRMNEKYLDKYQSAESKESGLYSEINGKNIYNKTNLDLEDPLPIGGPINVPLQNNGSQGFIQEWLPNNNYIRPGDPMFTGDPIKPPPNYNPSPMANSTVNSLMSEYIGKLTSTISGGGIKQINNLGKAVKSLFGK